MWTLDALASEIKPYDGVVWRVVETQYTAATMRLTDNTAEQEILERLLEETKPPIPEECHGMDYLLSAPFRYTPPDGSRFRRPNQAEGVFYASENVETAIAELCFYRLLFFVEAPEAKLPGPVEHTAFNVPCQTTKSLHLDSGKLAADKSVWTDPVNYAGSQALADVAREAGIEVIRYVSVRDPSGRANVALLSPRAFAEYQSRALQTWRIYVQRDVVRALREFPRTHLEFKCEVFGDPRVRTAA